jgi:hypothetical protein
MGRCVYACKGFSGWLSETQDEMGGWEQTTIEEILEFNGPPLSLCFGEIVLDEPFHPLKKALENGDEVEIKKGFCVLGGRAGVEPTTNGLKVRCSTKLS